MWSAYDDQRAQITQAGFDAGEGAQLSAAIVQGTGFEGVTDLLLLTGEDDYNTLAAAGAALIDADG